MMSEKALAGLARILLLSDPKDVKMLEIRTVSGMPQSRSRREAIAAILTSTDRPGNLLRHPTIKKAILAKYLKEIGFAEPRDLTKIECIRICLEKWDVEEDSTLQKYRTEEEVVQALARLDAQMQKKIDEIKFRYEQKRKPLLLSLNATKRIRSSSASEGSSSLASPSSSSQFSFCTKTPKAHNRKSSSSKRTETPRDEISIVMEKVAKFATSTASTAKPENIVVTPDIKPDPSTMLARSATPDSSDTASMFWVSW